MNTFEQFLSRNTVVGAAGLPLVHSTRAYHLKSIQKTDKIVASECDVFKGEKLNYFFVGRPSYKFVSDVGEPSYWEFPCCFIFDFSAIGNIARIFPFDTGAFHRKKYPNYIQMMDMNEFETSSVVDSASKIIGAYFGSANDYFHLNSKSLKSFSDEYALGPMDMELKALHRLSTEKSSQVFDDRRFAIEVQNRSDIDLNEGKPIAVIAPTELFQDKEFLDCVTKKWNAEPIPYPIFSMNIEGVYGQIYERVLNLYIQKGLI